MISLQLDLTIDKGLLYATLDEFRGIVLDYSPGRVIAFTPVSCVDMVVAPAEVGAHHGHRAVAEAVRSNTSSR